MPYISIHPLEINRFVTIMPPALLTSYPNHTWDPINPWKTNFEGNVQLKVHRLVMNACTEYFGFLEQTCPAHEENTIMMPPDLQADVIVPIVNFMYTGMLEYHASIYDKLYAAANTMNITVLTKLLEAQLSAVSKVYRLNKYNKKKGEESENAWKDVKKNSPVEPPMSSPVPTASKRGSYRGKRQHFSPLPRSSSSNSNRWGSTSDTFESRPERVATRSSLADNTPRPTRFEWPEDDLSPVPGIYNAFDEVSLTSKPLWTKDDDHKTGVLEEAQRAMDPARSKNNSTSQEAEEVEPERKVNISSSETVTNESVKRKSDTNAASSPKRIKITNTEDETVISLTTSNPSEVDHTKIVSEILKKYPDLVKKKKNIKLKITQSKSDSGKTAKEKPKPVVAAAPIERMTTRQQTMREVKKEIVKETTEKEATKLRSRKASYRAISDEGPWLCLECYGDDQEGFPEFVLYYLFRKHMSDQHQMEFDSSLCKYCGKKCTKENYMVYHLYTKHGLKPAKPYVFPKCSKCPFIAVTDERLQEHMRNHGPDEVQCRNCQLGFHTNEDLVLHQRIVGHTKVIKSILDCAYCQKKLQSPVTLFTHIRAQHLKEARRDGITSLNEVMDVENEEGDDEPQFESEKAPQNNVQLQVKEQQHAEVINETHSGVKVEKESFRDRVKIISNVKVAKERENAVKMERPAVQMVQPEQSRQENVSVTPTTTLANIGGNIGGSIATNLGLVDIVVLEDNQQYILQQPQGQVGGADFILPPELTSGEGILQAAAAAAGGDLNSTDELVMVLTDHDYPEDEQNQGQGGENSNIVVLYSHPVEGQQGQFITSQGNLLVNSDGMLEIRNGASITTTAGQIIVDNTTTTQAIESPIESIDLIRKEIEGTGGGDATTVDTPLKEKDNEFAPSTNEQVQQPETQSENHPEEFSAAEGKNTPPDTTDSTVMQQEQEEPMEVDENQIPNAEEPSEVVTSAEQENTETGATEEEKRVTEEESCENASQPVDIPPVSPKCQSEEVEIPHEDEEVVSQQTASVEPMEVDGTILQNHPQESLDEVDRSTYAPEETVETQPTVQTPSEEPQPQECAKPEEQQHPEVNAPTAFEDFTDESQHSAGQKTNKDLNKEILEDWDDTDSQASQNPENQEDEEEVQEEREPNENNATENVTKLMDDWEEEEEDQHKE
ncbi:centrosome-associated zinc finger protein CP190 isoform X2 [Anthonomus grandis grandis]|uniref:centrosome-associated zinc finger protein CP190 isoform X2 n=1 Tax=Anthonomus grandis grandis TaxID=2921223 RepID=UPI0021657A04|nr:centrosome-associated zinc finger protein CP190 isoform X2 [Anthonomus grandis grandis]